MSFGMTDKELRQINVLELLPQRPPFIMIDCLAHFNEKVTETEFEVRGDNLFYEDGQLSASALTENIAQTCAARLGYINKYILHCSVQLGFIGAIKNMRIFRTPHAGELLMTTIYVRQQIMNITLVDAEIRTGQDVIVTAQMKIAMIQNK